MVDLIPSKGSKCQYFLGMLQRKVDSSHVKVDVAFTWRTDGHYFSGN